MIEIPLNKLSILIIISLLSFISSISLSIGKCDILCSDFFVRNK